MNSRNQRKAGLAVAAALLVTMSASQAWAIPLNTPPEGDCVATLQKNILKYTDKVMKVLAACETDQLSGGPACPTAEDVTDLQEAETKAYEAIVEDCQSVCNISGVECIASTLCPPNGSLLESCSAGSGLGFNMGNIGFPGPYCDAFASSGSMRDPEDFGLCAIELSDLIGGEVVADIFGDLTGEPDAATGKCLKAISKTLPKAVIKNAKAVAKCRSKVIVKDDGAPPDQCALDAKIASKLQKSRDKLASKIEKSCDNAAITSLSICGNGLGGTTSVGQAQECLGTILDEASTAGSVDRQYAPISLINAAFPATAAARCGDNVINQLPNAFALSGEECDGTELGACASCLPPGDVFGCTCAETRRSRVFADGLNADLDNGWSGASHNSKTPVGAGFVSEISGCDCTDFTGATCTGTSGDSVCDVFAETQPRCSHTIGDGTTCDAVGNNNSVHADGDCNACSDEALNAGDFCTGAARYCVGGSNSGSRCNAGSDCTGGGTCSGFGRCATGSFAGVGCAGNEACGICTAGTIGAPCGSNSHCGIGGTCSISNTCSALECIGGASEGDACLTDGDCGAGRCASTSDCDSRCYTDGDLDMGPCWTQSDCGPNERCRGACNKTNYCLKTKNSAPLPLSSEGTSVCVDSQFFTNVSGTRDIVDGSHAVNYELRSVVSLGGGTTVNTVPCPVCGGHCEVSSPPKLTDRFRCNGTCTGPELQCRYGDNIGDTCTTNADCGGSLCSGLACRFDDDCLSGTCDGTGSPECHGRPCELDLTCSSGPNEGRACRVESYTAFGTTSSDCPQYLGANNYTGQGLAISWTPLTSGEVSTGSLEGAGPCSAAGFGNYDCNCGLGGGVLSQPNKCAPACTNPTNPADLGRTCANMTKCVGGDENGVSCDEDSDCSGGGTCTGNPRVCGTGNAGVCSKSHCFGGTNDGLTCASNSQCTDTNGVIDGECQIDLCTVGGAPCTDGECIPDNCNTNADCEMGVTCEDVCGGGLCTPLCVERGECDGGDRDGSFCALNKDCTGGGSCVNPNEQEGACANGVFFHCDGPGWQFVSCSPSQDGTQKGCEWGTDLIPNGPNRQPGAGFCRGDVSHCFVNDGTATGGGDATNAFSVAAFCIPASTNSAINSTAGLPGPGRIRQPATVLINFDQLP
jgi:hypothetical protein